MRLYRLPEEADLFDRAVDYGGYRHAQFFEPDSPTPLPLMPPPAARAGERCPCPACGSGVRYPVSPACRFWRADCPVCDGQRVYRYHRVYRHSRPRRWDRRWGRWQESTGVCFLCELNWHQDRAWFSYCLLDPQGAAQLLRDRAAEQRAANHTAAAAESP